MGIGKAVAANCQMYLYWFCFEGTKIADHVCVGNPFVAGNVTFVNEFDGVCRCNAASHSVGKETNFVA